MVSGQSRQLPFTVWVSSGNERLWIHGILKFGSTIRCTQRIQFHNPFFPWLAECWQIVFNITALNFYLDPVWVLYFRFFYFFNKNIQENASKMPTSNTAKPKRNPTEFEHPKEQEQDFFFFFEYWVSNIVHHNPPLLWMKPIHTCALAWFVYEDTGGSLRPAETPLMWSGTRVNVLTGGSLSFSKNRRGFDEKEKRARSWFSLSWENKSSQFEPCLFFIAHEK